MKQTDNLDYLCYDKHKTPVKEGDVIRIKTAGSLNGEFVVERGLNAELQIEGTNLSGFYPGTYEVLKYSERVTVPIELWVTHRSQSTIKHIFDTPGKNWRACALHSDGKMEWEWCDTFDEAVAWCKRFLNYNRETMPLCTKAP